LFISIVEQSSQSYGRNVPFTIVVDENMKTCTWWA